MRYYAGHVSYKPVTFECFSCNFEPTERSHGHVYNYVIGPFRTKRAAIWFTHNPWFTGSISEMEQRAKIEI